MKIIEENIQGGIFDSAIFSEYFGGMEIIVADIETTGLSPRNSAVILGGAVIPHGEGRLALQYFADTPKEEEELLIRYGELLSQADIIVTYNGDKFDLPFLRQRMNKYGINTDCIDKAFSIDLFRILKKYSDLPKLLPNMKQKTVEAFLGDSADRTDEIDGKKSVEMYFEYCESSGKRREQLLDWILLHNRDDIVRLSDMIRIVKMLNLHEIMYNVGFPVGFCETNIIINEVKLTSGRLTAKGSVTGEVSDYIGFGSGYKVEINAADRYVCLEAECQDVNGHMVIDLASSGMDIPALRELGNYESGYLILKESGCVRHQEVNRLVRALLQECLQ